MEALKYRPATDGDLPVITDIYNAAVKLRYVTADTETVTIENRKTWFSQHNQTDRPLLIFLDAGEQIIGWLSFQSFYGRPAYSHTVEVSVYLAEPFRGRGFGKKILAQGIEIARQHEIKTLVAFIFSHNEISINLFEGFQFDTWGELIDIAVIDGVERSLKILGKRIVDH